MNLHGPSLPTGRTRLSQEFEATHARVPKHLPVRFSAGVRAHGSDVVRPNSPFSPMLRLHWPQEQWEVTGTPAHTAIPAPCQNVWQEYTASVSQCTHRSSCRPTLLCPPQQKILLSRCHISAPTKMPLSESGTSDVLRALDNRSYTMSLEAFNLGDAAMDSLQQKNCDATNPCSDPAMMANNH